jgi:hypothetical protein
MMKAEAPVKWHPKEPADPNQAADWHGDGTQLYEPADYRREYVDLSSLHPTLKSKRPLSRAGWLKWYDEQRESDPEYYAGLESAYKKRPEDFPIHVQHVGGRRSNLDGSHRIAIAHKLGMTRVPAFVGYVTPGLNKAETQPEAPGAPQTPQAAPGPQEAPENAPTAKPGAPEGVQKGLQDPESGAKEEP